MTQTPDISDDPVIRAAQRLRETEAIVAALGAAMAQIDRERRRVRPEDWETLFRQMRTILEQIATHPFIAGDTHAEMLVERLVASPDLAEFDARVDKLGEYIAGKLAYNAALTAIREGREPDPAALIPRKFGASSPGSARVVGQYGPSGSDFEIAGGRDAVQPRRGILRL